MRCPDMPLPELPPMDDAERLARARAFAEEMARRRSVREFAPTPVPRAVIEEALRAAASAPSGNQQPWRFVEGPSIPGHGGLPFR